MIRFQLWIFLIELCFRKNILSTLGYLNLFVLIRFSLLAKGLTTLDLLCLTAQGKNTLKKTLLMFCLLDISGQWFFCWYLTPVWVSSWSSKKLGHTWRYLMSCLFPGLSEQQSIGFNSSLRVENLQFCWILY